MSTIIQQKRGTASQWTATTYLLSAGEFGWETDTNRFKIGDGSTVWGSLPYAAPSLSHTHGNISNSGLLTTSVTATNPVKVLITNSSDAIGLLTTINASATTFLRGDGTWVTPTDTDTNYYPTAVTMTAGTTAGPLVGLTMNTGTVTFATIPSATTGASGIVTTGAQNFDGIKTFNSFPQVASGLPSNSLDLVNKQYVDNIASGINAHDSVIAATTAALTATYNNNTTGIGSTLTNSGTQAALVIDNVSLLSGDRVLVKNQGTTTQNGIYSVTNVGTGSTNWVLTRTSDYDQSIANEVQAGDTTFVVAPTAQYSVAPTNNNTSWTMNSPGTISIGSSAITFVQTNASSGYTAGTGISINSGAIAIDTAVIPRLGTANAFTVGGHTITNDAVGTVPLAIKNVLNQTANMQEWQFSTGVIASRISSSGQFVTDQQTYIGSGAAGISNSRLNITTGGASVIGAVIRGAASQTANLTEWQTFDGTNSATVAGISPNGRIFAGSTTPLAASLGAFTNNTTRVGIMSQGATNQTADLFQVLNSAGTILGGTTAIGQTYAGSTAPKSGSTTYAGLALTSASGSGTAVTYTTSNSIATQPFAIGQQITIGAGFTPAGYSSVTGTVTAVGGSAGAWTFAIAGATTGVSSGTATATISAMASITSTGPLTTALIVQNHPSQNVNLQEWQSSTGTALASIAQSGQFRAPSIVGTAFQITSGGVFSNGTATAPANMQAYFLSTAAANVGMVVRGFATGGAYAQTADLMQFQTWDGTTASNQIQIAAGGQISSVQRVTLGSLTNSTAGHLNIILGVDRVGLAVRSTTNAISDLVTYGNSIGTILGGHNTNSQIYTGSTAPILSAVGGTIQSIATGANPLVTMASAHGLAVGDLVTLAGTTGNTYNGTFVVATVPLTTTFTIVSALTTGQAGAAGTIALPAQTSITARSAGTIGLVVQGASSQSAVLTAWRTSAGSTVASMNSAGYLSAPGLFVTDFGDSTSFQTTLKIQNGRNISMFASTSSFGGGQGVLNLNNATTVPTSNPTGGGILYVDTGALKYRGTSGSAATIINADGTSPVTSGFANPMTTAGDIIYGGASGAATRLAASTTSGWVLTYDTSLNAPKWTASAGGGSLGWLGTTQTTASSGGTNSLTGVNTFTGATSGNIVMSTVAVTGSGTQTSTNTTLATGNATGGLGAGGTVTSGNLTIKTGDATSDQTGVGGVSNPGNVYIQTGAPFYDDQNGGANPGKVYVGTGGTGEVVIGNPNGTLSGASTISIAPIVSSLVDKTVSIANDGRATNITLGTGSTTSSTIRLGTSATAVRIDLGNNNTSSATYLNGKNFFWQPLGGTASSPLAPTSIATTGTTTLTAAQLLTFIVQYTGATAATFNLPTGTLMDSNVQNSFTAMGFDWSIIATAAGAVTVSGGTGHTYVGNPTVLTVTSARFRSVRSTTNVWITFRIG